MTMAEKDKKNTKAVDPKVICECGCLPVKK